MRSNGYTLVEMILVVVIIGILASVAIQSLNKTEGNRRLDDTMAEMEEIARAIVGDERLISSGARTDFGYVGDIGSLPSSLDDLVTNPGGYATWKGPYIRNNFIENSEDYKRDAWDNPYAYTGGITIASSTDGSPITKQLAASTGDLISNTIKGVIRDKAGLPPSDSAANVNVTVYYPDGSGSITSATTSPSRSGEFSFDNQVPIGIHLIRAVYSSASDTASKYLAVNPGSIILTELRFPSELWAGTGVTVILRPIGAGLLTELATEGCVANWQCVDEVSSDEDGTRVIRASSSYGTDLYEISDPTGTAGAIDSVIVYATARREHTLGDIRLSISSGGFLYTGVEQALDSLYAMYSYAWPINPNTGLAWTWPEISDVEAGAIIRGQNVGKPAYITQIWMVVAYTN
ncbi:MAG: prepilin-type N-terminal cleavage/methylation domain-containing protein [Candidatus Zixiibacteriota bacterium]|nr:MAG: prepilin-type N-terminal cleavage/methylation domain-containing protein [candidate division Zixibacteria bacterium]